VNNTHQKGKSIHQYEGPTSFLMPMTKCSLQVAVTSTGEFDIGAIKAATVAETLTDQ